MAPSSPRKLTQAAELPAARFMPLRVPVAVPLSACGRGGDNCLALLGEREAEPVMPSQSVAKRPKDSAPARQSAAETPLLNVIGQPFVLFGDPQKLPAHRLSGHLISRRSDELRPFF